MKTVCKCPHCGGEINPASLLGQGKKTMSEAAKLQRKQAAKSRWAKKKGFISTPPQPSNT